MNMLSHLRRCWRSRSWRNNALSLLKHLAALVVMLAIGIIAVSFGVPAAIIVFVAGYAMLLLIIAVMLVLGLVYDTVSTQTRRVRELACGAAIIEDDKC